MKRFASQEIKEFFSKPLFDEKVILNKDPSWPKISIVTPSFNQAQFLERTILSVLNQNYPNLEYIIIDGGSTDGSVGIIKRYEKYLTYWVSEKDKGQTDGINKGFRRATGNIVGWQNSDDIYLPGGFEKVVQVFKSSPEFDIVFGNSFLIDKYDNKIGELRFTPFSIMTHFNEGMSINNQSSLWKRDLMSRIGMLDTQFHFCMDYEFYLRAKINGAKFKNIHVFLGAFRQYKDSKSGTIQVVKKNDHAIIESLYSNKIYSGRVFRILSNIRRIIYYLIQGDWDYLYWGFIKRLNIFRRLLDYLE